MRLMVIGWDGATFRALDPWLNAGLLPTLSRLLARGVRAPLLSTVPPVTAPAWVSCFSGVNPGRHGIFNFVKPVRGWPPDAERPLHSSRDVRAPRLWHLLNEQGLKTHVVDVPLTFPPEPLQGVMVSDLMVAGDAEARTFPESLREELRQSVGADFSWAIGDGLEVSEAYLTHLARSLAHKARLDRWLIERDVPDAFLTVYQHTDVLAHYFWHLWDETHPAHDPALTARLKPALLEVLAALDSSLATLLSLAGDDALVVMVSDHGFGPARVRVHPNELLLQWGLLTLSRREKLKARLARRGISPSGLIALARKLDVWGLRRRLKLSQARAAVATLEGLSVIPDLPRSKAWFSHGLDPGICLSPEARQDPSLVSDLMARLRNARPEPGAPPYFERVQRREEVFSGPYVTDAPEIVLQLADGYVATPDVLGGEGWSMAREGQVTGFHRPEGILVLAGPGVREGVSLDAVPMVAVLPTLLAGIGLPVPGHLDGHALVSAFEDGLIQEEVEESKDLSGWFSANNSDKFLPGSNSSAHTVFDADEQAAIRRRLEALGYH